MIDFLSTLGTAALGLWVLLAVAVPLLAGAAFFLFMALNWLWLSWERRRRSR